MSLLLFPHQLFPIPWTLEFCKREGIRDITLWEDPVFYGDRRGSPHGVTTLQLNPLRVAYSQILAKVYVGKLRAAGIRVNHRTLDALKSMGKDAMKRFLTGEYIVLDPADHLLNVRLEKAGGRTVVKDSPMFLLGGADITEYAGRVKGKKRLQHRDFYKFVRGKLGVLEGAESTDKDNRKPFPRKGEELPSPPFPPETTGYEFDEDARKELWKDAPAGIDLDYALKLPLTQKEANAWLQRFLRERFVKFGVYEDAMVAESQWMFHSGISVFLNFGLLLPKDVVKEVAAAAREQRVPEGSLEGFIRQLIGWREYARFYYIFVKPEIYRGRNVFGGRGRVRAGVAWYKGTTGLGLVDAAIKDAWRYGYLHHIRRLMVMSNAMLLSGLSADAIFAWMYEFSLDSWDWVMVFNVYSMGAWCDGGYGMRKPYISGSGYLRRMNRGGMGAEEAARWDGLFRDFLARHEGVLRHTPLAGLLR